MAPPMSEDATSQPTEEEPTGDSAAQDSQPRRPERTSRPPDRYNPDASTCHRHIPPSQPLREEGNPPVERYEPSRNLDRISNEGTGADMTPATAEVALSTPSEEELMGKTAPLDAQPRRSERTSRLSPLPWLVTLLDEHHSPARNQTKTEGEAAAHGSDGTNTRTHVRSRHFKNDVPQKHNKQPEVRIAPSTGGNPDEISQSTSWSDGNNQGKKIIEAQTPIWADTSTDTHQEEDGETRHPDVHSFGDDRPDTIWRGSEIHEEDDKLNEGQPRQPTDHTGPPDGQAEPCQPAMETSSTNVSKSNNTNNTNKRDNHSFEQARLSLGQTNSAKEWGDAPPETPRWIDEAFVANPPDEKLHNEGEEETLEADPQPNPPTIMVPINTIGLSQSGWLEIERARDQVLKYLVEEDKGKWTEEEQKSHGTTDFYIRNVISYLEFVQGKILPGKLSDELACYLSLAPFSFQHKNPDHPYNPHAATDTTCYTPKLTIEENTQLKQELLDVLRERRSDLRQTHDREEVKCRNCLKVGHIARYCRTPRRQSENRRIQRFSHHTLYNPTHSDRIEQKGDAANE